MNFRSETVESDRINLLDEIKAGSREIAPVAPAGHLIIAVESDAMEPLIRLGDAVICNTAINRYAGDALYVLQCGDVAKVRRIQLSSSPGIAFHLLCDNPLYDPESIPEEAAHLVPIIGKVTWHLRRM